MHAFPNPLPLAALGLTTPPQSFMYIEPPSAGQPAATQLDPGPRAARALGRRRRDGGQLDFEGSVVEFKWNLDSGQGLDDGFLRGPYSPLFFLPFYSRII